MASFVLAKATHCPAPPSPVGFIDAGSLMPCLWEKYFLSPSSLLCPSSLGVSEGSARCLENQCEMTSNDYRLFCKVVFYSVFFMSQDSLKSLGRTWLCMREK